MTTPDGEIYLAIEYPGGTVGVVRQGPHLVLSDEVGRGRGAVLDGHDTAVLSLTGDHRAEGGRLPPGAVTAIVTDDAGLRRPAATGGGAWSIVLDQHCDGRPSPVCFRDADGALVVPPLPTEWSRSPILDVDAACPACDSMGADGSAQWDVVYPTDESRGASGPNMEPVPIIVCRSCGYEHSAGGWFVSTVGGAHDDEEHAQLAAQGAARRRHQARASLANLQFPVFAARGWPVGLGGWSASGGEDSNWETISVTVDHGPPDRAGPSLSVETSKERGEFDTDVARARSMLAPTPSVSRSAVNRIVPGWGWRCGCTSASGSNVVWPPSRRPSIGLSWSTGSRPRSSSCQSAIGGPPRGAGTRCGYRSSGMTSRLTR